MQVTVSPYYTISASVLLEQHTRGQAAVEGSRRLNLLLDIDKTNFPGLLTVMGSLEIDFIFSLPAALTNNHELLRAWLPGIYLLAACDGYTAGANAIPVFAERPFSPASQKGLDLVKNYFDAQGNTSVRLPVFNYGQPGIQHAGNCLFFGLSVTGTQTEQQVAAGYIIIGASAADDAAVSNALMMSVTTNAAERQLETYYVERTIFEEEINNWQQRALLYKSFLTLSKSVQQKEYYEVLDWYHKEYEALPLWYKQFGHIVKVMTGKRSFKSLFNDKLKKHKD